MIKKKVKKVNKKRLKNDKQFDKFKKYIEERFKELLKYYLVDFVSMTFRYPMKQPPTDNPKLKWVLTIGFIKKYRSAYVDIYDCAFDLYKQKMFKELDRAVLHELNHLHTIPTADIARDRFSTEREIEDAFEELTEIMTEYQARYIKLLNKKAKKLNK